MENAAAGTDIRSIDYGQKTISYRLVRSNRKTMEIAVHPDASVVVKAPVQSDIESIESRISKRARWILRQINYFKQFHPKTPARCNVNGETHRYLGKQYRLKATRGDENSVKLSRGYFHVTCRRESDPETVQKLLNNWYLEKARQHFTDSLDRCWPRFQNDCETRPVLRMKRMKARWGSLSGKGIITLNTDLVKAPTECIDYVVTHELCHLKVRNHSKEFYRHLESFIPNWKATKHKLELSMS